MTQPPYRTDKEDKPRYYPAEPSLVYRPGNPKDLVQLISGQQLKFDCLSKDTVRQLLYERQKIRDKNRSGIMGQITDVSGEISCCENLRYNPDARERGLRLAKLKIDLESEARDQDVLLWRDTFELRRALIDTEKRYESTKLRTGLVSGMADHNESRSIEDSAYSGSLPGA